MAKIAKAKTAAKAKANTKAKVAPKVTKAKPVNKVLSSYKEALTKSQLLATLAEATELSKKQVTSVFDMLSQIINAHIDKRSIGQFTIPGLLKIVVQKKAAVKARKGISPFNGEEIMFKAKPARRVVKIRALKKLKEMAE